MMTAAIVALALSTLLLGGAIMILVMLRRGDGPVYSTSRSYDANRREALRVVVGAEAGAPPQDPWFAAARRDPIVDAALDREFREVAAEALRTAVSSDRGLVIEADGQGRVEGVRVVPAISTADLRASGALEAWDGRELLVGLVLVNSEPPGGDARRVTLPVQVLFPSLERAGRGDLIRRFEELRDRAAAPKIMEVPS
jgi:hypothetical protein